MSGRIRVRCIYTRYPHWGAHAGYQQMLKYLDAARFSVYLHASSDSDADLPVPHQGLRESLRKRAQKGGMEWYKLSDLAAEIRALPGSLVPRARIVHSLDAEHGVQYLPRWLRGIGGSRTKTVGTYHQPPDLLPRLVDGRVVAQLDHVVVVSPSQVPFFTQFLPADRVEVILHGIDTEFFRPDAEPHPPGRLRCVTVGHWLRDWATLREAALSLRSEHDIEFHVVTDRETGLQDLDRVVTHRNVDDDELLRVYQSADVLLLPLTQSTANNSLLEGIACGLPVVTTDLESTRAYLPGGQAILCPLGDANAVAAAVLRLAREPAVRSAMAASARARAEALSWRNIARRYEEIYARLVRS